MSGNPLKRYLLKTLPGTHLRYTHLKYFHSGRYVFKTQGFTYISVLVLIVVTGITLAKAGTYWSTHAKRERETEMLFRGNQIRKAIESYYKSSPQGRKASYPRRIDDLLKDPRYLQVRRHIRKLYNDPMTDGGKWGLIFDSKGGVKGVYSKSRKEPVKVSNFPSEYKDFEKAKTYADWKFIYVPKPQKLHGQKMQ